MAQDPSQAVEVQNALANCENLVAQLSAKLAAPGRCPTCEATIARIAALASQLAAALNA